MSMSRDHARRAPLDVKRAPRMRTSSDLGVISCAVTDMLLGFNQSVAARAIRYEGPGSSALAEKPRALAPPASPASLSHAGSPESSIPVRTKSGEAADNDWPQPS